jgi:hypothetical protein
MEIFESLLAGLRTVCAGFTDARRSPDPDVDYSMADIGLSAFSLFFMQSESFLSHQRRLEQGHGTSNCQTLFGMKKIPTDNYIRLMLDPVSPEALQPCFDQVIEQLRRRDGLKAFQRLAGRTLVALDGTEYFCSQKLSCPQCLTRKRANGKLEHYHAMLAAMIVAPGHNRVLPLMPEFITPQDGAEKQDCERNAAKRWLSAHHARVADLRPVYLGDALFSCQPLAEAVLATGADFLFVCKKDGHKTLYEFIEGAPLNQRTVTERKPGKRSLTYHYRWIEAVPLRDGKDALNVNWLSVTITDEKGKVTYDGAFVTSLPITAENVVEIAACARARWKIENESFNVLKNNGYNLAHNFGHGKKYLARTFAAMNLLAFAFHTACDCLETLWQQAREAVGTRARFFQDLHTITTYVLFPSWNSFMNTVVSGKAPPI